MSVAFIFPGQGSQAVGMGKALAEQFPAARAVFDEVDDALGQKLSNTDVRGPRGRAYPDRQCPARADGRQSGRCPRARSRSRSRSRTGRGVRGRPFARRILGARGGGQHQHRRYGAASAHPRRRHAGGRAGGAGRHGRTSRPRFRSRCRCRCGSRAGRGLPGGQRQRRRPGRRVRYKGGRRALHARSRKARARAARCSCRFPRLSIAL